MQTKVLLSIKPQFAYHIFLGKKRYEFRRAIFKDRSVKRIVVYASSPVCKVIGEFEIEDILELEKENLWKRTCEFSGIPKEYFDTYFHGKVTAYAIKIGETKLYDVPLELESNFNIRHPPQSFTYLPKELISNCT